MGSNEDLISFEEKFRLRELHVADVGGWVLSVRPGQLTLGSMVLSSGSGAACMADLSDKEREGLGAGLALAEKLVRRAFDASRINYLCLMMQDPIVHFHVFPRYARSVEEYGHVWEDPDWPGPPMVRPVTTEDEVLAQIKIKLELSLR